MNREGPSDDPQGHAAAPAIAPPLAAPEPDSGAHDAPPDNVIAFPRARTPTSRGPFERPGVPSPEASVERSMTADEFERAIQAAIAEKVAHLGELPGASQRSADELVAQVFAALSGKAPDTALAELRARLADGPDASDDPRAEVVHLDATPETRQRSGLELALKLGGALKEQLEMLLAKSGYRSATAGDLTIDGAFLKQYWPALLANLLQGLGGVLGVPKTPPPEGDPDGVRGTVRAEMNLRFDLSDLGQLVGQLFRRMPRGRDGS